MTEPTDTLPHDLARLPAPPIDPALAARAQRRARGAYRGRSALRLDVLLGEAAVPAMLLLAGVFYTVASLDLIIRIWGS